MRYSEGEDSRGMEKARKQAGEAKVGEDPDQLDEVMTRSLAIMKVDCPITCGA